MYVGVEASVTSSHHARKQAYQTVLNFYFPSTPTRLGLYSSGHSKHPTVRTQNDTTPVLVSPSVFGST